MNDDWRVQIDHRSSADPEPLVQRLEGLASERDEARALAGELSSEFHDTVIVSRDGPRVFLYAGSREQAEAARRLVERLAGEHGWELEIDLKHWHPEAEAWGDPDQPLPAAAATRAAEHAERIAAERRKVAESGRPELEVRADLGTRHEAARFAERLQGEGLPVVHRWRYLLVGATDEDAANALAERIRGEAPAGSRVYVEGTWQEAWAERPPNPFAFLGGLGDS